jgi:Domain of unknown function (DUF4105)
MSCRRIIIGLFVLVAIVVTAIRVSRAPSNDRVWHPHQRREPRVTLRGPLVEIRNVRDFVYGSGADFEERYVHRTYDLRKLDSAWYVVSRFGSVPGLAHAFLTFGFGDEYVGFSVEARKEQDETYSPLLGMLNSYELMYVAGSERDLIGVRTHVWKERVTLYPVRATPEKLREVFLDMALRAEGLARKPEFYDTLFNSCNSNIVQHVNAITPGTVGFDLRTVLPGFSDRVAYELGLIDSSLPLERVRELYRVDQTAAGLPLNENFSRAIRAQLGQKAKSR